MGDVATTKQKVGRILQEWLGAVSEDKNGHFTFAHESIRVFIEVGPLSEGQTYVSVLAPTNFDLNPSPELFHFVATHAGDFIFGHMVAIEHDRNVGIMYRQTLLGDFLDPEELKVTVRAVVGSANKIDDEIRLQFGGNLWSDDRL